MKYLVVTWKHDSPAEPVMLYSECDDAGWETRKVEVSADGRAGWADGSKQHGGTRLGLEPLPSLEEIAADSQFAPRRISAEEFEQLWAAVVQS